MKSKTKAVCLVHGRVCAPDGTCLTCETTTHRNTTAAAELLRVRRWVREAIFEIKLAQDYNEKQYSGPGTEALHWARQLLENALIGKEPPK